LFKQAAANDYDRVNKLSDILLRRDDRQLPLFCDILRADRQPHIVELFRRNGLMIYFQFTASSAFAHVIP